MKLIRITIDPQQELIIDGLLQQNHTVGRLEGVPNDDENQQTIQRTIGQARQVWPSCPVQLIAPVYHVRDLRPKGIDVAYQLLPPISVVAHAFRSDTRRPEEGRFEELVIVWFQDVLVLPIDPAIVARLTAMDWQVCA